MSSRSRGRRTLGFCAAALLLLLSAAPPARSARWLQQDGGCPDLVPGAGAEAVAEVAAGSSAAVAAFRDVGPIYLAASAEDGASSGEYALELWDAATGSRAAEAASAGGCATTPVYDACADGPAAVEVRLRCINGGGSGGEPCQVRVAAYMSACPGGPQPQAVALDGGSNSGGDSSSTGSGAADAETTPSPPPSNSPAPGSSSDTGSDSSGDSSGDDSFAGLKTTTWIAIGVGAAALLLVGLALWCFCRRRRRQRRQRMHGGDVESGGKAQQFLVSSGGAPQPWQQQGGGRPPYGGAAYVAPPPAPAPPSFGAFSQAWAFGYKVAGNKRDTFVTDASRRGGLLQHWTSVDDWLAAVVTAGRRWEGCLMYNDDPPKAFPDGSPTDYPTPAPYKPCGHCKGLVLWDGAAVGWLVHSVPCWPCHARGARGGVAASLSPVQDQQTNKGQSFIFVQLQAAALPAVLAQVQQMQALVYFRSDPRVWPHEPRDYYKWPRQGCTLVQLGPGLWHAAKANAPEANFYEFIQSKFGGRWQLRTNITVQDKERNVVPSSALLENVSELAVPGWDHKPYLAGSEHAKMGVCVGVRQGAAPPQPLVLVGDINNTYPSWKRGGGGIVVQHPHLSELLRLMVVESGSP